MKRFRKAAAAALMLTVLCLAVVTCGAETKTMRPLMSGMLKDIIAGKTFTARLDGYATVEGSDEATLMFVVCERDHFDPAVIESLAVGDEIVSGKGITYPVNSVKADEFGFCVNRDDPLEEALFFFKDETGDYIATNETDFPFWHDVIAFEVRADSSLVYKDFSDPEADEPTELDFAELMRRILNEEVFLDENNTSITFDDQGRLTVLLQNYSPFN
ncbi:MAG: hypothetical protein IJ175_02900 [Clostridia bacterium]|nr:hypothetical protein [Clostridia bacterium]